MNAFTNWLQSLSRRGERPATPIDPATLAARTLNAARTAKERAKVRSKCDEMRQAMGMPPCDWGNLA